jgi:hypothetical protein
MKHRSKQFLSILLGLALLLGLMMGMSTTAYADGVLPLNWADSKLPKTMSLSCYEHCHRKKKAAAHMVAAAFHEKAP